MLPLGLDVRARDRVSARRVEDDWGATTCYHEGARTGANEGQPGGAARAETPADSRKHTNNRKQGYIRLPARQAGGHWFEPSTAHLPSHRFAARASPASVSLFCSGRALPGADRLERNGALILRRGRAARPSRAAGVSSQIWHASRLTRFGVGHRNHAEQSDRNSMRRPVGSEPRRQQRHREDDGDPLRRRLRPPHAQQSDRTPSP